jgi:hypothetical protein
MALNFPPNPEIGDEYIGDNGITYVWDGVKWAGQLTQGSVTGGGAIIEVRQEGITVSTATGIFNFVGAGVAVTSTNTTLVTVTIEAEPLTTATTATLGGVKIGSGISISEDGVISVREGLEYWTESKISNEDSAVISFITLGTETNITAVIKSKGTGATTNSDQGNTRGEYAVDWQSVRGANNQVASGNFAVISGGSFNRATGLHSVIVGGNNNVNDADYAVVLGGVNGNTKGIKGSVVIPGYATNGAGNSSGKIQSGIYIMSAVSVDAVQSILSTDGQSGLTASTQVVLQDRSTVMFAGTVIAREIKENSTVGAWKIEGIVKREIGSTTTNFVSAPTITPLVLSDHTVTLDIESSIGCFFVRTEQDGDYQGQIQWVAKLETVEVGDFGV